jgi:hypothetical protein
MNCETAQQQLGAYLDGELAVDEQGRLREHIARCAGCAAELKDLRELVERVPRTAEVKAPAGLWDSIEQRLDSRPRGRLGRVLAPWLRRPFAAAASIALLIGAGVLAGAWLTSGTETAKAIDINFNLLIEGLNTNADAAVASFLQYYHAEPITAEDAHAVAPHMSFAIPPELPGGFRLERVYRLRLGSNVAIAACYRRGQEPLDVFFHPPVDQKHLGVHTESHCLVGGHHAHSVEVGPWRLLHFTEPTTCHCVLSRLDMQKELPAVMAAVAPGFAAEQHNTH